ncbi:MAG: agmatinase family protein [Bacteroidia bacterium]|nr:agmatinase family protein [Bacteroidia bacterium]
MNKEEKINRFDPSGVGLTGNQLFGLPFNFEESEIVILPVPWDVTASFGSGTAKAPGKIFEASTQVDLYDFDNPEGWQRGYFMLEISDEINNLNRTFAPKAKEIIRILENGGSFTDEVQKSVTDINEATKKMVQWVFSQSSTLLHRNKKVAILGGDHSVPLGYYRALAEKYGEFGILQIDAHADLRKAYQGFDHSHASIMFNASNLSGLTKIVQFGVRDLCIDEIEFAKNSGGLINTMSWNSTFEKLSEGATWASICSDVVSQLPEKICLSIDIDGLDPAYCPKTGTPVPGGPNYDQLLFLLKYLKESGKEIIGFDICECGDADYDANVGARLLYKMCNYL